MGAFTSLFLLALLATVVRVDAAPRVTIRETVPSLSFSTRIKLAGGHKIADMDRARIKAARERHAYGQNNNSMPINVPINNAAINYLANVGVGNPPTYYSLLVDTGSSNTWIGANKPYVKTNTSIPTGYTVNETYGSGNFYGDEYLDQVTIASDLVITNQSIGVAISSQGFNGTDGIIGVGPEDLTLRTLGGRPGANNTQIPTVTDNLFAQGAINSACLGVSFQPTTSVGSLDGELTFGGTDPTKYTGEIHYSPITSSELASYYWGIDQSIKYGDTQLLYNASGIVDTGTTLLLITTDALVQYQRITGAVMDNSTGLLSITSAQLSNLQSLYFTVSGVDFEFTSNAQILPRTLNEVIGGNNDSIYLIVGDLGPDSGKIDFINGYAFLQRFYSVFDTTNRRVGLATTQFTNATTN